MEGHTAPECAASALSRVKGLPDERKEQMRIILVLIRINVKLRHMYTADYTLYS